MNLKNRRAGNSFTSFVVASATGYQGDGTVSGFTETVTETNPSELISPPGDYLNETISQTVVETIA